MDQVTNQIESNPANWLDGHGSITELISALSENYEIECQSLFFLVLNPDSTDYGHKLDQMEIEMEGHSVMPMNPDLNLGFNSDGEVGRVVAFADNLTRANLIQALGDVAYVVVELNI